jgi:hypothetical protein
MNIRKRVNEILAESSGCLSTPREKTRPQDFMITTYDVLSPEETPQPGKHTLCTGYPTVDVYLSMETFMHGVQKSNPWCCKTSYFYLSVVSSKGQ